MTWDEVDVRAATWTLPGTRTKNGKAHVVHLSEPALSLLASMPAHGSHVFTNGGNAPFQSFSAYKRRLDDLSRLPGWRLHDLRRTVVSGMASLGVAPHVADRILNHVGGTISGVAAVYQRHEFLAERRAAMEIWGAHVSAILRNAADA